LRDGFLAPEEETQGTDAEPPAPSMKAVPDTRNDVIGTLRARGRGSNGTPVHRPAGLAAVLRLRGGSVARSCAAAALIRIVRAGAKAGCAAAARIGEGQARVCRSGTHRRRKVSVAVQQAAEASVRYPACVARAHKGEAAANPRATLSDACTTRTPPRARRTPRTGHHERIGPGSRAGSGSRRLDRALRRAPPWPPVYRWGTRRESSARAHEACDGSLDCR
jgi:hypothetical protein